MSWWVFMPKAWTRHTIASYFCARRCVWRTAHCLRHHWSHEEVWVKGSTLQVIVLESSNLRCVLLPSDENDAMSFLTAGGIKCVFKRATTNQEKSE